MLTRIFTALLFLVFICSLSLTVCLAQPPAGVDDRIIDETKYAASWTGALDVGAIRLSLVFHIKLDGKKWVATLDSPDQGAKGIPLDEVSVDGKSIRITSKKMKAKFTGELNESSDQIVGTWSQGGREFSLDLKRALGSSARRRPQTPRPPFTYEAEEVTFPHQTESFRLAGTLTYPRSKRSSAAVVLISGSGPQDRDQTIFDHRPFAVLADHLSKAGMVVLRVDDRGVGGTGVDGNPQDDTTVDFASDVRSAVAFLRTRNEVDPKRIGLIGHSEGALIGAMVAAEDKSIAFLVLLASPAVPGDELLSLQSERIARASGASESEISNLKSLQSKIFSIIRNQPDIEAGKREAREILLSEYASLNENERKSIGSADRFVEQHSAVIGIPWFRYFLSFDPRSVLEKVACPVLALTGAKDLQVAPEQNLPKLQSHLTRGRAADGTVKELPGLNHLLQQATTGLVTEYGEIEESISPMALNEISSWLRVRKFAQ